MKSKKAETYLNRIYKGGIKIKAYHRATVNKAVEIAEKEMEEKAIEAHFNTCPNLYDRNCDISENGICEHRADGKCKYMNDFIEELNK